MSLGARLEKTTSAKIVQAMRDLDSELDASVTPAPCHIVSELHAAVLFPFQTGYMLAYRCQLKWWGRALTESQADTLKDRGRDATTAAVHQIDIDTIAELLLPSLGGITDSAATFVYVSRSSQAGLASEPKQVAVEQEANTSGPTKPDVVTATTREQFRACLRNDVARSELGLGLTRDEALAVADDNNATDEWYAYWQQQLRGSTRQPSAAPVDSWSPPGTRAFANVEQSRPSSEYSPPLYGTPSIAAESSRPTVEHPLRVPGFVLSLLSIFTCGWLWSGLATSILAVVFSAVAMAAYPPRTRGRGLTIAGLVLGIVYFLVTIGLALR